MSSLSRHLLRCLSRNFKQQSITRRNISFSPALFSYTRTDVTIPVPITGGHLAAQLWEKPGENSHSKTPIICMHGYQDNSCSFDPLIPLIIKDGMKIVAVDLPGHGLSSQVAGAGSDFTIDGVAVVHRVMRHFNWDKVTILGHSYGSILSFHFVATFPDKVEKYIAIENVYAIPRDLPIMLERTCNKLFEIEEKLINPNRTQPLYTMEELVKRTDKGRKGTVTEAGIRTLLKRGAVPDSKNPDLFKFSHDLKTNIPSMFGRVEFSQSLKLARGIKCPVCVIKGDPGEDYEPRGKFMEVMDALKETIGDDFQFHLVPGTHHLHLNDPSCVAPIISRFLE